MPQKTPYFRPSYQAEIAARYEGLADRLAAKRFYASARWIRVRLMKLRESPLCEPCLALEEVTPAKQVHHVQDRRANPELAFDLDNLESVCVPCHNAKRALTRSDPS